jgi:hypothetical protein
MQTRLEKDSLSERQISADLDQGYLTPEKSEGIFESRSMTEPGSK